MVGPDRIPIPALLATAAVHHHLIRKGLRTSVGLVVETGEAREVHHFALLAGYGAEAINPYLAFETLADMADEFPAEVDGYEAVKRYIKSIDKGLLKVMSKMGISTYQSYCGAQIFDAVGLVQGAGRRLFHRHRDADRRRRPRARSPSETVERHRLAFGDAPIYRNALDVGGDYAYRIRGEAHNWTPDTVALLQHAVRGNSRGQISRLRQAAQRPVRAIADDPRPVPHQGRRGRRPQAGSAGGGRAGEPRSSSASPPAPCPSARSRARRTPRSRIAMNRIGGKSNTGEGGEESDRFKPMPNGDTHALGDQAGRLGPVRRDDGISRQFGHDPDQDGAGRQARRGRPAARPQGRRGHRQGAPFDPGRRPDLAAAASRHLFDRRSGAADLRPEERQSARRYLGQAGVGSRRRHGRRRRLQGPRRPCDHLGLRGRHGRFAADLDQARRQPVGNRPRRDPPDAGAQPPALAHRRPGRRRLAHRPRRRRRRPARRR